MSKNYWFKKDITLPGSNPKLGRIIVLLTILTLSSLSLVKNDTVKEGRIPEIKRGEPSGSPPTTSSQEERIESYQIPIKRGDSLYGILTSFDVTPEILPHIIEASKPVYNLERLVPGRTIKVGFREDRLVRIEYPIDELTLMVVKRVDGDRFKASKETIPLQKRLVLAMGKIEESLYEDMTKLGIDPEIVMNLADIFAWEIDFTTDMRKGDTFRVLYEEGIVDGRVVKRGPIVAAMIMNQGKRYMAFLFEANGRKDYYNEKGRSLRKQFLKSPLNYRRISSFFSRRRYHPILKTYRPHHGVDYAAPVGTPVVSTGDGKVVYAGWKGGYGKLVVIRHNGTYSTVYGHLSHIAKGIRVGRYVKQGQVIGYVGSTGLSTGPHLHYEFRVRGKPVNPLTYSFPPANPVPPKYKKEFDVRKITLLSLLNKEKELKVAVLKNNLGSF